MSHHKEVTYLPLFFDLTGLPCLVVGGGKVAQRKVEQLLNAGAKVTIVAPEIETELQKQLSPKKCEWQERDYISPEASGYHLVIAATDNLEINQQVYEDCQTRGIPVNVVDQPHLCSVIFPAIARRGFITLAISSGGKTPFFTNALRKQLEAFLADVDLLEKPELLTKFRDFVMAHTDDFEVKKRLYQRLLSCDKEQRSQWSETEPPYDLWSKWLKVEGD